MDHGWIITFVAGDESVPQISLPLKVDPAHRFQTFQSKPMILGKPIDGLRMLAGS